MRWRRHANGRRRFHLAIETGDQLVEFRIGLACGFPVEIDLRLRGRRLRLWLAQAQDIARLHRFRKLRRPPGDEPIQSPPQGDQVFQHRLRLGLFLHRVGDGLERHDHAVEVEVGIKAPFTVIAFALAHRRVPFPPVAGLARQPSKQ